MLSRNYSGGDRTERRRRFELREVHFKEPPGTLVPLLLKANPFLAFIKGLVNVKSKKGSGFFVFFCFLNSRDDGGEI